MKLYTRDGDHGDTSLFDGSRVPKSNARVWAYGETDELNSLLGWCGCAAATSVIGGRIQQVQNELFMVGAELATPPAARSVPRAEHVGAEQVRRLEGWIDEACEAAGPLTHFILPGGTELAARLHVARTCCRRVERTVVALHRQESVREELIVYLNRLGDLLFAWARQANREAGVADVEWTGRGSKAENRNEEPPCVPPR